MIQYAVAWQKDSDNLGDDLRTLAAMELLPRVDRVLDAGRLDMRLSDLGEDDRVAALLCGSEDAQTVIETYARHPHGVLRTYAQRILESQSGRKTV